MMKRFDFAAKLIACCMLFSAAAAIAKADTPVTIKKARSAKVQESSRGKAHLSGLQHRKRATGATVGAIIVLFVWNRLVAARVVSDPGAGPR